MEKRRFELVEGTSSKFWEVETRGAALHVRYGRIGSDGQASEKKLASAADAEKEAEKLVREKTKKGYVEVGDAKAADNAPAKSSEKAPAKTSERTTTSAAPTTKAAAKKAPAKKAAANEVEPANEPAPAKKAPKSDPILPVPGLDDPRPGTFAFTAALDALFARGWPHLRVLTDEAVSEKKAIQLAKKALTEVDPYLPTIVPRDVARRVLIGFAKKTLQDRGPMEAAITTDRPVDAALLEEIVGAPLARETYVFRLREITFLLEAFVGTEPVAEAIVAWCARALEQPKLWGDKFFVDHENANFRRVLLALGWLRLRMPEERWRALVAPLAKANKKLPLYSRTLRMLVDDAAPLDPELTPYALDVAVQRKDAAFLRAHFANAPYAPTAAERIYALGSEYLLEADLGGLSQLPKWWQERMVAELGTIAAPGTVRVIATLLSSRSAGVAARAWLDRRREWVERVALPVLDARPADAALVAAVRAAYGGAPAPKEASPAELEKELSAMLAGIPAMLKGCDGDPARELAGLKRAFAQYCELRAAMGEVIPEAYFTHMFIDMKFGEVEEATFQRWMDLAMEAASP